MQSSICFLSVNKQIAFRGRDAYADLEVAVSNLTEVKARAEVNFKRKQEKVRESEKAWAAYAAEHRRVDEKTASLKSLRLAKEAAEAAAKGNDAQQGTKKLRRPFGSHFGFRDHIIKSKENRYLGAAAR